MPVASFDFHHRNPRTPAHQAISISTRTHFPLNTKSCQLFLWIFSLLAPVAWGQNDDRHGTFQLTDNGELVVTQGVIIRETQPEGLDKSPLLAVGSADGIHHLYDPNTYSVQAIWSGSFGRVNENGEFEYDESKLKHFLLRDNPWSFGEAPFRKLEFSWKGYTVRDDQVHFRYRMRDTKTQISWVVEEHLEIVSETQQNLHFSLDTSDTTDEYLNYWVKQTHFRRLSTNGQQNQRNLVKNLYPNQKKFTISFYRRKDTPTVPHGYSIREIPIPEQSIPIRFEPTDIDFAKDGSVYVSNRTGSVWRLKDDQWSLFAEGLHEAIGIRVAPDGSGVYVMQKPELTFLQDTDGDGVADHYVTHEDRFRFTGQYHEFAYGPRINSKGDLFFSTGLASGSYHKAAPDGYPNQMGSALGYRGWVMKRSPDGSLTPFASGLRSPAGIGMNAKDELFITDNQGDWVASSYLGHVEEGDFLGHPASFWDRPEYGITPAVLDYKTVGEMPKAVPPLDPNVFTKARKMPAVWLAHGDLTNSPGSPSFPPGDKFGPFAGQAFIADISHRTVVRVALEKVNGAYQGAVFPFIRPLISSSFSTAFDPDGNLWVGSVGRGWTPGEPAIEVISYDPSKTPFEIQRIELTRKGFDLHFTQPLEKSEIANTSISITEFQFKYWDTYGSEPFNEATVLVKAIALSPDQRILSLELPLKAEYIYNIQLPELMSSEGLLLENNFGIYTLNQLLP